MTVPKASYTVEVDWENSGDFLGTYDDISADIMEVNTVMRGKDDQLGHAQAGVLELRLRNDDKKYSPENASSPLHDYLLPYRPIRLYATWQTTTYFMFVGYISRIRPHPHPEQLDTYIYALDKIDGLARGIISTPVFNGAVVYSDYAGMARRVASSGASWASLRTGAGTGVSTNSTSPGFRSQNNPLWNYINRGLVTFNTYGKIDSRKTVAGAAIGLCLDHYYNACGRTGLEFNLYMANPANPYSYAVGDYQNVSDTPIADFGVPMESFTEKMYKWFLLNETGVNLISTPGIFCIGIREVTYDVGGEEPPFVADWAASELDFHIDQYVPETLPKLSVSYL